MTKDIELLRVSDERLRDHLSVGDGFHALKFLSNTEIQSVVTELLSRRSTDMESGREPVRHSIEHDGFVGTVIGHYTRLDGKTGVVMQQDGTNVVHVYGTKWLRPAPTEIGKGEDGGEWVLVPREPTTEQIMTQGKSRPDLAKNDQQRRTAELLNANVRSAATQIYREMVAAAPTPPSPSIEEGESVALEVEWVVNEIAELGVKIGEQFFFCYKGRSLTYTGDGGSDVVLMENSAEPMHWRPIRKREFGECIHPINYADPTKVGTVSLDDSDEWKPLPAAAEIDAKFFARPVPAVTVSADAVDDMAALLWRTEATDAGVPQSVIDGRTRSAFDDEGDNTKDRWRKFARAALSSKEA